MANVHIFRALKSFIFNIDHFWDTLYSSFSKNRTFLISLLMDLDSHGFTDCENMCLYAGRIRILWPMLGGAVSFVIEYDE